MAQGPSDTILVAIRITLRIRESKVRNPDHPDRWRFVLCECILVSNFFIKWKMDALFIFNFGYFTCQMPFLSPNQQCQKCISKTQHYKIQR